MNINDYVLAYGDDSFKERELCAADALVFASLGFVKFEKKNLVPSYEESNKKLLISEIPDEDIDIISENEKYGEGTKALLRNLKTKKRYKDISIQYQFSINDKVLIEQIYAITLNIPDFGYFIVFRGTDGTKIGWYENFLATVNKTNPSQLDAVEYLNIVHRLIGENTPFMVTGHSKGGTLTLYSTIFVEEKIQKLITKAYYFEGPGLPYKFYNREEYLRVKDRIISLVPRDSIFGELFYTPKNPKVVLCDGKGLDQHNQFNWQIKDNDLYFIKERNPNSRAIQRASKIWAKSNNKNDFMMLIEIFAILFYVEGNEDYISPKLKFKQLVKRFKEIKKKYNFIQRLRFYRFAVNLYLVYKNSEKYYKKKDKEMKKSK